MSTQFTSFRGHAQSEYHASVLPKYKSVLHLSCPSSVHSSPLLPISSKNTTTPAHLHLMPKFSKYTINPAHGQSECHLSNLCPVSTPSLLLYPVSSRSLVPMHSQYTISPSNVQSVNHLFCTSSDSTPFRLAMSNQNTTFPVHIHTETWTLNKVGMTLLGLYSHLHWNPEG